jgi:hypothetical protein
MNLKSFYNTRLACVCNLATIYKFYVSPIQSQAAIFYPRIVIDFGLEINIPWKLKLVETYLNVLF